MASKTNKDYLFVGIQLLLFIAYFLPIVLISTLLPNWLRSTGLVFIVLGITLGLIALFQMKSNLSPYPIPLEKSKLLTSGAFAISRHPIYTALIFSGLGYGIYQQSMYKILITFLLLILFLYKSRYEESLLSQKFPEYKDYKKKTRRFI